MTECNVGGCTGTAVAALVGLDGYEKAYRCRACLCVDLDLRDGDRVDDPLTCPECGGSAKAVTGGYADCVDCGYVGRLWEDDEDEEEDGAYLRCADRYVPSILEGRKRSTLRYALERDFALGDDVELRDESGDAFATATIVSSIPINLHNVAYMDLVGLREDGSGYDAVDDAVDALREHYAEPTAGFDGGTVVDMITFAVQRSSALPEEPLKDGVVTVAGVPVVPSKDVVRDADVAEKIRSGKVDGEHSIGWGAVDVDVDTDDETIEKLRDAFDGGGDA